MTLWIIIRNSLRQHALSTGITAVSIGLAMGLFMAIWTVKEQSMAAFTNVTGGFDAVMGSRGSELSLVLFSVFHMDKAPGTLPPETLDELTAPKLKGQPNPNRRFIKRAVPLVVGDNHQDFRIVGTTREFFEVPYRDQKRHALRPKGRLFGEQAQEAVLGSYVADRLGMKVGQTFRPMHGINYNQEAEIHPVDYLVVGILEPSNTPADRAIWIPMKGAQNMPGHRYEARQEISAILLQLTGLGPIFVDGVNKGTRDKTVALIAPTVTRFFQRFEWVGVVLGGMAALVALVGAGAIMASLHNTMNERRREIAILRSLGARRGTVFSVIVLESMAISALGVLMGAAIYVGLMLTSVHFIHEYTGVVIRPWETSPVMLGAPLGVLALGALAGLLPAAKAYRTDVASHLIPQS